MLALVSTRITTFLAWPAGVSASGRCRKGRANPKARRQSTRQRKISKKMFSSRLRRVSRGGVGCRNMSELKMVFSREVRRMRWKMMGAAMAAAPTRNNGARKLMSDAAPDCRDEYVCDVGIVPA